MTAIAGLRAADRERLLERVRELDELDDLMRERGTLASLPEPAPLCRAGRDTTTERTTVS